MFNRLKNFFRQTGAEIGMVESLTNITDHKKINVDPLEYQRINKSRQYLEGKFDDVKYKNTYGVEQTRPYMTINMMKVVVKRLASLLYNEQCRIKVGDDEKFKDANDFIENTFNDNDFNKNFERYLESDLALGGLVIRPYFDKAQNKIKLAWCQAPTVYPLKNNTNDVSDIAIATVNQKIENDKVIYYTLLEFHEWINGVYTITNELYRSENKSRVGIKVPLNTYYEDLPEKSEINNIKHPIFVYMKPQGFNNRNIISPLGIGICDNALETLKQINDTFDKFNWEIQMGQRRVGVPSDLVATTFDEQGSKPKEVFDTNQNVFFELPGDSENGFTLSDLTPDIRTDEFVGAINNALRMLELQTGFSAGTFSFDAKNGMQTATEVVSENSMTYQTRNSQLTMVERGIKELIIAVLELASTEEINLYDGKLPTLNDISIDFDDGVFTDKKQKLDYYSQLLSSGLVSKLKAIKMVFGVTDDQAQEMLDEINEEVSNSHEVSAQAPMFANGDE
ncbi:phage portal protein [Companilactobacillus sp. DQM5]|uniref:phage portal protein n=1 Tax=Companilactobacillus sp. DQM5 TaxID=3463359 RepID=UPI004058CAF1